MALYNLSVMVEATFKDDNTCRVIIFDNDPDTGAKSIEDILEMEIRDLKHATNLAKWSIERMHGEEVFEILHADTYDFGRARTLKSKLALAILQESKKKGVE